MIMKATTKQRFRNVFAIGILLYFTIAFVLTIIKYVSYESDVSLGYLDNTLVLAIDTKSYRLHHSYGRYFILEKMGSSDASKDL